MLWDEFPFIQQDAVIQVEEKQDPFQRELLFYLS